MAFWKSVLVTSLLLTSGLPSVDAGAHGTVRARLTQAEESKYGPDVVVKTFFRDKDLKEERDMTIVLDDLFQDVAAGLKTSLPKVYDMPAADTLVIGPKHNNDIGKYMPKLGKHKASKAERARIFTKLMGQIRPLLQTMYQYGFVMRDPHAGNIMEDSEGNLHLIDPGFVRLNLDMIPTEFWEYIQDAFPGISKDLKTAKGPIFEMMEEEGEEVWATMIRALVPKSEGYDHLPYVPMRLYEDEIL